MEKKTHVCAVCGTERQIDEMAPIGDPSKELPVCLCCSSCEDPTVSTPWMFVLGAPDPEMIAIRDYLIKCKVPWMWGSKDGKVLTPATSRKVDHPVQKSVKLPDRRGEEFNVFYMWVECCPEGGKPDFDHHFPGDRGYGAPPEDYWRASSIGQVWNYLADHGIIHGGFPGPEHVSSELRIIAAADHCLRAAYAGECPGVTPEDVAEFRITSRARFQGRSEDAVIADIESAMEKLRSAPILYLDQDNSELPVRDMRSAGMVPELPEAAVRLGVPFIAQSPGGKVVLQAADPITTQVFMACWAPTWLTGIYGDPARGFAGGFVNV